MIADYFNEVVQVERVGFVSENSEITKRQEFLPYLENLCCNIQPLDSSLNSDFKDGFGKNLIMFCAVSDIVEGDRVTRENGTQYKIVAVETFEGIPGGRLKHSEITLRAFEQ
jgi:hypothetical protein